MGSSISGESPRPADPRPLRDRIGVVAIGRNEGERLRACLQSLVTLEGERLHAVYVDSGSTDGSLQMARVMGVATVELDMSVPFTAARARNAGFARLVESFPDLQYVQFIDGDCEMLAGWIEAAVGFLDAHEQVAVACGHRRERYPDRSLYNLMCDIEWGGPVGEVKACGGDAVMDADAFRSVAGFRPDLIAGEEPELCVRLRQSGWRVFRLDREMCLHDAAMTRFGQWWQRSARAGHAFAEGAWLHGRPPDWHGVRPLARCLWWALVLPIAVLVAIASGWLPGALLLLLYPIQIARIAMRSDGLVHRGPAYAFFLVIGKFAELHGAMRFLLGRMSGRRVRLIEYK